MSRGSWALAALVLVASYCAGQAGAYSSGAPDAACGTMQPGHSGSPQSSTSPFSLTPFSVFVEPGQRMLVTLESTTGTDRFMGFMIQARDSDTDQVIGTFFTTDHKYLTCGPGFNNAVTHSDGSQKGKVVLEWEPKSDFQGDIVFKGSFVKNYSTYWTGVTSEKVTVKRETPPPPSYYYPANILLQETYSHVEDQLFNIDKDKYDIMVALGPVSTAEDPPLCAFLDAATQCENLEVATLCTKLCTPAEDPPLCALLDAATQCENFKIAKLCTQLCIPDQCPVSEGFLLSPDGTECYIAIRDERRSWSAADSFCKAEGMMLAEPADRNAPWLQKTLNEKYGGSRADDSPWYWVGAHGSGSGSYVWQQQQQQGGGGQVNTNMWQPGFPLYGGTTEHCVLMNAADHGMRDYPGTPYFDYSCSDNNYPICQRVLV